jgi:predicted SnoaL-like aldol condensation-catalyzing enzyme
MGLAPTGNKIKTTSVDIHRIVNGKIAEYWNVTDTVRLLQPQGVIEITEVGKNFFPEFAK